MPVLLYSIDETKLRNLTESLEKDNSIRKNIRMDANGVHYEGNSVVRAVSLTDEPQLFLWYAGNIMPLSTKPSTGSLEQKITQTALSLLRPEIPQTLVDENRETYHRYSLVQVDASSRAFNPPIPVFSEKLQMIIDSPAKRLYDFFTVLAKDPEPGVRRIMTSHSIQLAAHLEQDCDAMGIFSYDGLSTVENVGKATLTARNAGNVLIELQLANAAFQNTLYNIAKIRTEGLPYFQIPNIISPGSTRI